VQDKWVPEPRTTRSLDSRNKIVCAGPIRQGVAMQGNNKRGDASVVHSAPVSLPSIAKVLPISCFIIAQNEADRIARTIRSVVDWVDEVIVIDSGSIDSTVEVAASEGARVVFNEWRGFGQQKRFGEDECRNDWILNIDADEVVSAKLEAAIHELFAKGDPPLAGYGVWISIIYPGSTKPRPLARDCYAVRLYDRRRARFKDSTLFDSVDLGLNQSGTLSGVLDHYSARTIDDLIHKNYVRATYNAANAKPRTYMELIPRFFFEFPFNFFKYYFLRTHFLGGIMGLRYASIISYFRWVRIIRLFRES
jgi:glycosyltransferase involved in cell wall biosynthesis